MGTLHSTNCTAHLSCMLAFGALPTLSHCTRPPSRITSAPQCRCTFESCPSAVCTDECVCNSLAEEICSLTPLTHVSVLKYPRALSITSSLPLSFWSTTVLSYLGHTSGPTSALQQASQSSPSTYTRVQPGALPGTYIILASISRALCMKQTTQTPPPFYSLTGLTCPGAPAPDAWGAPAPPATSAWRRGCVGSPQARMPGPRFP